MSITCSSTQPLHISIDELELNDDFGEKYSGTDGMLNGIIDMIIENEDTLILADYKTDRINDTDAAKWTIGGENLPNDVKSHVYFGDKQMYKTYST